MAKRRVNLRVAGTLGFALLGLGAAGVILLKHHAPVNPQVYADKADELMKQEDWGNAIPYLQKAVEARPDDVVLHVKLGRCYFQSQQPGTDALTNAISEFTKADTLDPQNKEAWKGLYDTAELRLAQWEARSRGTIDPRIKEQLPKSIALASTAANHLHNLDAQDPQANSAGPILLIRAWLLDLPLPPPPKQDPKTKPQPDNTNPDSTPALATDQQRVDAAIIELTRQMREHPESDQIPYWIARAKCKQADNIIKSGESKADASALFAEAAGEFDQSIAAKPELVALYLNKASILQYLQSVDGSPTAVQTYLDSYKKTLEKAQSIADPKHQQEYLAVKMQWANLLGYTNIPEAEKVYRDLIALLPDDLRPRIALAQLLERDPSRRGDALAVLDAIKELPPASITNVAQRFNWQAGVAMARKTRAEILVAQLRDEKSPKKRDQLATDIRDSLDAAGKVIGGPDLLLVRGEYQLAIGDTVSAVQTLTQASDGYVQATGKPNLNALRLLAQANLDAKQTGKAIQIYESFLDDPATKNSPDYHTTLARLYIDNGQALKAKPHVDWLLGVFPDEPSVLSLEVTELVKLNEDPKKIHAVYDKLPEKDAAQISSKIDVAALIGDNSDRIRLMMLRHQSDPGNLDYALPLVQQLINTGRAEDANKVLDEVDAKNPGNEQVKLARRLVGSNSARERMQDQYDYARTLPHPDQEIMLAALYEADHRPEDQLAMLEKAITLQPDNAVWLQEEFVLDLSLNHFDKAEALLPKLADLNADNCHGMLLKCKYLLAKQDVPDALLAARQLVNSYPQFAPSVELYGEALMANSQWDQAGQQLNAALRLQGNNVEARRNLIECDMRQGKLEEARADITTAREQYPDNPQYLQMSVQYELSWGNPETVLKDIDAALAKNPELRINYGLDGDALLGSMRYEAGAGHSDKAADYLNQAIAIIRAGVKKWPDDPLLVRGLSQMLMENKDQAGAISVLQALMDRPHWKDQPYPLILLGNLYLSIGNTKDAEPLLVRAVQLAPQSADACTTLANCYVTEKKYDDAVNVLRNAVANFSVRQRYTDLLLATGHGDLAEMELNDAIQKDPSNYSLHALRMHVYDVTHRYDAGLHAASAAIEADRGNTSAYFWRGKFEASGSSPDFDKAIKDLSIFRDANPRDLDGHLLLAQVMQKVGDQDDAIREYETALSLDSQNRQIRLALLSAYTNATPPRTAEADRFADQTTALPAFKHDYEFESKSAVLKSHRGMIDEAITLMRQAMQDASKADQPKLVPDYFAVLLAGKKYDLLLQESDAYKDDPKALWFVFSDRGIAWGMLGKYREAAADFQTALDRCGIETDSLPARVIVNEIVASMNDTSGKTGSQWALDMVVPRARNSVAWKMMAVDIYAANKDFANALKMGEDALESLDTLKSEADRQRLLVQLSSLYLNANPPQADKALKLCEKMLAANPNDMFALNDAASVLIDYSTPPRPKEALVYSQRAYDLIKDSPHPDARVMDTHGWVLVQVGRVQEGRSVLGKAIAELDSLPEAHYHLAMAYLTGDSPFPEEARRQLDQAMATGKNARIDTALISKIEDARKQADKLEKGQTPVSVAP